MLPPYFLADLTFLAAFLGFFAFTGFAGSSKVASTVRSISASVTPLALAFRIAFLIRFTAFFCFFASAIVSVKPPLGEMAIVRRPSVRRMPGFRLRQYTELASHSAAKLQESRANVNRDTLTRSFLPGFVGPTIAFSSAGTGGTMTFPSIKAFQSPHTRLNPGSCSALRSKVAVVRQPNRRLRALIRQSAKSVADPFHR
jgi:hypothetical protein